jgi:hypothetical protein
VSNTESAPEANAAPAPVAKSETAQALEAAMSVPSEPAGLDMVNESAASEIDVPMSDFWDNKPKAESEVTEEPAIASLEEEVVSDVSDPIEQTITFKANGEDVSLTLEEARSKLAMAEGGAKAFTKLAQANKRLKELESSSSEYKKKAELIDKLESIKHNEDELIRLISGKDPQEWKAEILRKERILSTGSAAEKSQLEKDERIAELERKQSIADAKQEELAQLEQERSYNSEKSSLNNMLEGEFFKHKLELGNDIDSNDANELLWADGNRNVTKLVAKYKEHPKFKDALPKIIQKAFGEAANKLNRLATGSVQTKVDEAIKAKKEKAAANAAVASTRHISEPNSDDYSGLGVREMIEKLTGKKGKYSRF